MRAQKSTALIIGGILITLVGSALFQNAGLSYAIDSLVGNSYTSPSIAPVVIWAIISLVGVAVLLLGVSRLTANIDNLALHLLPQDGPATLSANSSVSEAVPPSATVEEAGKSTYAQLIEQAQRDGLKPDEVRRLREQYEAESR